MKNLLIKKTNTLLIKRLGVPKREKPLPNPLDTLIATILSQNTNDNNSYKAYQNLKRKFPKWEDILSVKKIVIENLVRVGGLAKQKSKAIINLLSALQKSNSMNLGSLKKFNNEKAIEYLISFDGVGVKTASCVLLFSLDRNICPVDTHVHRTVNRIGIVSEKTPDKTFYILNDNLPEGIAHSFHTNLIRLGREFCKPTDPLCFDCPLLKICNYQKKNKSKRMSKKMGVDSKKDFMLLDNIRLKI